MKCDSPYSPRTSAIFILRGEEGGGGGGHQWQITFIFCLYYWNKINVVLFVIVRMNLHLLLRTVCPNSEGNVMGQWRGGGGGWWNTHGGAAGTI